MLSLGHTTKASQDVRKFQLAMIDHFGLNSLFLTIIPDDECSFQVRLYADPNDKVQIIDVSVTLFYLKLHIIMFSSHTS